MKRILLTTSVLALGLAGTAFAQTGAGNSVGAGQMGTNSGSPSYSAPSSSGSAGIGAGSSSRSGSMDTNSSDMNGAGANGGPMASNSAGNTSPSGRSGGRASSDDIRQAQEALQDQGLYHGQVDGKWGPETKRAVSQFQKQKGLKQTAQLDHQTLNDLQSGSMSGSDNGSSPSYSSGSGMGSSSGSTTRSPNGSGGSNSGGMGGSSRVQPNGAQDNGATTPAH